MGKYIVIALDKSTAAERSAITDYLAAKPWGYWHWFQDVWFIPSKGTPAELTPKSLYQEFEQLPVLKSATIVILAFNGQPSFYGRANPDAWKWLTNQGGAVG